MSLTVKQRVGIAMAAVVLVNLVTGSIGWALHLRATESEQSARRATERAEWVAAVSEQVTVFVSEATELALSVAAGVSEESSAEYGDLVGADRAVTRLIDQVPADLDPAVAAATAASWESLRPEVFVWVNAEAERAGSSLRLTLNEDGQVRASTSSNIGVPARLEGLDAASARRVVRSDLESFHEGRLRRTLAQAGEDARDSVLESQRTRRIAVNVTIAAIGVSVIVALMAAVWLYRTIAGPLAAARQVAQRVAGGDYSATFDRPNNDEIGTLVHAVEEMRDAVVGSLNAMREMAGAVIATAGDVAAGARTVRKLTPNAGEELSEALDGVEKDSETLRSLADQMLRASS
ncbi:MAG: methyl-accepting chemotaxis protein [Actinobacteria bacterium]|nr:methyl-accepting chemotaxis protein [Actinomycetota bacterium]